MLIQNVRNNKAKLLIVLMITVLSITSCGTKQGMEEPAQSDFTEASREVNVEVKERLNSDLTAIIHGEKQAETFRFSPGDVSDKEINNIYNFNNSIYIQVDCFMYRFQLDDNEVISYIRYWLEG